MSMSKALLLVMTLIPGDALSLGRPMRSPVRTGLFESAAPWLVLLARGTLAPSPFALAQNFRTSDFEPQAAELVGDEAMRVLLQLPNLSDTKGLVADAVASGLQVSVVSTQMQTRVIVEGSRRVLQTYVRAIPGRYTGEVTITWDGTATVR